MKIIDNSLATTFTRALILRSLLLGLHSFECVAINKQILQNRAQNFTQQDWKKIYVV